jgi:hypothetical protein
MLKRFAAALIFLCCAGCIQPGNLAQTAAAPNSGQTYFIMGVRPSNLEVMFFEGEIKNGIFDGYAPQSAKFRGAPTDGYIVGSVKAGGTYAITELLLDDGRYTCDRNVRVLAFTAPAGKVIYLTHANYKTFGSGIGVDYRSDIEGARAFLATHYPQLADRLQAGQIRFVTSDLVC